MNKASKKQLNLALKAIIDRLEKTEKFVLAELPDLCQQILKERAAVEKFDAIKASISTLVLVSVCAVLVVNCMSYSSATPTRDGTAFILGVISLVFGTMGLCEARLAVSSVRNLVSLKVAPKLYVLEKLKGLVSKE